MKIDKSNLLTVELDKLEGSVKNKEVEIPYKPEDLPPEQVDILKGCDIFRVCIEIIVYPSPVILFHIDLGIDVTPVYLIKGIVN